MSKKYRPRSPRAKICGIPLDPQIAAYIEDQCGSTGVLVACVEREIARSMALQGIELNPELSAKYPELQKP